MKVLIISDEEELLTKTNTFFTTQGIDTICYKWLLKALDNIEEIQPNLIVLSSSEYPRHWKTLVQFVKSGIGGNEVNVFLYEPNKLSIEEDEKVRTLGVTGTFNNLEYQTLMAIFSPYLKADAKIDLSEELSHQESDEDVEVPTVESIVSESLRKDGYVVLTNPRNSDLIAGKVCSVNHNRYEVELDYDLIDVENNDFIKYVTYSDGIITTSFSAEIFILNPEKNTVILTMKEEYES